MKRPKLRFILWICLIFALVGLLIYFPLSLYLPQKITAQVLRRDLKIAAYIAEQIKDPLLTRDTLALNLLLHDNLEKLEDSEYIFIQNDKGEVVVHTFSQGFPIDLLKLNQLKKQDQAVIKKFLVKGKEYYDLAVPILAGGRDSLHLGVALKSGQKEIAEFARINYYVAGAIFVGLGFGFLILLGLSIGEARRVSGLEERNKLAVTLHDGLAQSLASIVVRLELCRKLFEKEPERALSEVEALKGLARELVKQARQAIDNLRGGEK